MKIYKLPMSYYFLGSSSCEIDYDQRTGYSPDDNRMIFLHMTTLFNLNGVLMGRIFEVKRNIFQKTLYWLKNTICPDNTKPYTPCLFGQWTFLFDVDGIQENTW